MKTLYLECNMGASGDMLMGALLDLLPEKERKIFLNKMNALGLNGVTVEAETGKSCGVTGLHAAVRVHGLEEDDHLHDHEHEHHHEHEHQHEHDHEHDHEHEHEHTHHHSHTSMADIRKLVSALPVSGEVKLNVLAVYQSIAEAESEVHGTTVSQIHFHEVGTLDAVADITGVCLLMDMLDADRIVCSTVHTGYGQVRCAHGILPVPAPATALLLRGIPCTAGKYEGELITPTGAALLAYFAEDFSGMPEGMITEKIGTGLGTREFPAANMLRAFLGETGSKKQQTPQTAGEEIWELRCNLDDMTGEDIGYACDLLLREGALDVFTAAIQMKKSRPGVLLTVLCRPADEKRMTRLLLEHTTTLGVRRTLCQRTGLTRTVRTVQTEYGPIRVKVSTGEGITRTKPEYDDVAAAAEKYGVTAEQVRKAAEAAL